jgi:hypothetical protein
MSRVSIHERLLSLTFSVAENCAGHFKVDRLLLEEVSSEVLVGRQCVRELWPSASLPLPSDASLALHGWRNRTPARSRYIEFSVAERQRDLGALHGAGVGWQKLA